MSPSNNVAVSVDCNAGGSINAALATLTPTGPNSITVMGTCNENVTISDFRELAIVAGASGAKIIGPQDNDAFDIFRSQNITLKNLEIAGVPGSTPGSGGIGVTISEFSDVQIKGCDIHDNQGGGVAGGSSSLLSLRNTNIHNNTPGNGLQVGGNSNAAVSGSTIQNNGSPGVLTLGNPASVTGGVGVFVGAGNSGVGFSGNDLIQNNADVGIWARVGSTVTFGGDQTLTTTIQGHNLDGIVVQGGGHLVIFSAVLVQGNGVACPPVTSIACGGIFGVGNATVELAGVGTISGNHGAGIFAEQGTNLHLNGATISNNSGDGVHIRWISTADIREFGGGANTITGNGGASVFCDATSLVIGNLSGFPNVKCGQNSPN
jgi:hypothetical protein